MCVIISWLWYLLHKLMKTSTLGYSCTAMYHQSAIFKELFCDEVLFTFFGALTLPHLPNLLLQFMISYIFYNPLWQLPENRCWFFPPLEPSWIMCQAVCPLHKMQHVLLFCYNKSNENGKILISSSHIMNSSWYHSQTDSLR